MSAVVKADGAVRQLGGSAEPGEIVKPEDVQDADKLSRLLMRILGEQAKIKRQWKPRFIDFEARTVDSTGTTLYRFTHNFNAPVRWWSVDWSDASAGERLKRHADSDLNTLVLVSYTVGVVSLRVEEAG